MHSLHAIVTTSRYPIATTIPGVPSPVNYSRPWGKLGCTTRLWQVRYWVDGWHAQAQLERVFRAYGTLPWKHGQTSLAVPPGLTTTILSCTRKLSYLIVLDVLLLLEQCVQGGQGIGIDLVQNKIGFASAQLDLADIHDNEFSRLV